MGKMIIVGQALNFTTFKVAVCSRKAKETSLGVLCSSWCVLRRIVTMGAVEIKLAYDLPRRNRVWPRGLRNDEEYR